MEVIWYSILWDAMNHGMSDPFGCEQKQCQHGESDLKTFGVELFLWHRLLTPLCGGFAA